jgi:hypothetical protein
MSLELPRFVLMATGSVALASVLIGLIDHHFASFALIKIANRAPCAVGLLMM